MVCQNRMTIIIAILLSGIIMSCASGPKDAEVIELVKKECLGPSDFLLEMKIEKKGGARKPERYNIAVYPVTVSYRYIRKGLLYGWVAGTSVPYFEQYYEDTEWHVVTEFLIGKDQFNEWDIVDSRRLEYKEVQKHKRPKTKSMEEYYANRIISSSSDKSLSDSIAEVKRQCKELQANLDELKVYVMTVDSLKKIEMNLMALNFFARELSKNRFLFAHILEEIAKNLPEFTWLSSLNVSQNNVKIIGITASNLLVADFINRLEESPYISNVDLTVLEKKTIEKQELMEFTLIASVGNN